jgi:2'-5' RNA ligase
MACAGYAPLKLGLKGCGAFPPRKSPSVVWLGLAGELEKLSDLASDLEKAMQAHGFEPENRPFRPHLTLGRVRRKRGKTHGPNDKMGLPALKRAIAGFSGYKGPDFSADRVILMMSILRPKGPIYDPLHTVTLA